MKQLVLMLMLAVVLAVPAFADVISPGELLVQSGVLPVVLVILAVLVTALLMRKKKK